MSLKETEAECAAVAKAPRVSLADIEGAIASKFTFSGGDAAKAFDHSEATPRDDFGSPLGFDHPHALDILTICIVTMRNGFAVIGKSAPASPENFNKELGAKLAYEDAIRQLWPLMGFALRDRLHRDQISDAEADAAVARADAAT